MVYSCILQFCTSYCNFHCTLHCNNCTAQCVCGAYVTQTKTKQMSKRTHVYRCAIAIIFILDRSWKFITGVYATSRQVWWCLEWWRDLVAVFFFSILFYSIHLFSLSGGSTYNMYEWSKWKTNTPAFLPSLGQLLTILHHHSRQKLIGKIFQTPPCWHLLLSTFGSPTGILGEHLSNFLYDL